MKFAELMLNFTRWQYLGVSADEFRGEVSEAADYPEHARYTAQGLIVYKARRRSGCFSARHAPRIAGRIAIAGAGRTGGRILRTDGATCLAGPARFRMAGSHGSADAGSRHGGRAVRKRSFSFLCPKDAALAKKLTEVCAVDIFAQNADGSLRIVEANLDECVLCDLCIQAAPGKVRVLKLYE